VLSFLVVLFDRKRNILVIDFENLNFKILVLSFVYIYIIYKSLEINCFVLISSFLLNHFLTCCDKIVANENSFSSSRRS
jgi:hypothetical protein